MDINVDLDEIGQRLMINSTFTKAAEAGGQMMVKKGGEPMDGQAVRNGYNVSMHNVKKNAAAGGVAGEMREVLQKVAVDQVELAKQVRPAAAATQAP